jgi:prepilin-type N-terminal cleavage/methylation domain-containing protein
MVMKRTAMTLIEMLMSIAIIAILSSSAVVSLSMLKQPRLDTAARNLVADIRYARGLAVNTGVGQSLNFSPTPGEYRIYRSSTLTTADYTDLNLTKRVMLGPEVTITANNLWISTPRGNMSGPTSIRLQYLTSQKNITIIGETGNVRVEE